MKSVRYHLYAKRLIFGGFANRWVSLRHAFVSSGDSAGHLGSRGGRVATRIAQAGFRLAISGTSGPPPLPSGSGLSRAHSETRANAKCLLCFAKVCGSVCLVSVGVFRARYGRGMRVPVGGVLLKERVLDAAHDAEHGG